MSIQQAERSIYFFVLLFVVFFALNQYRTFNRFRSISILGLRVNDVFIYPARIHIPVMISQKNVMQSMGGRGEEFITQLRKWLFLFLRPVVEKSHAGNPDWEFVIIKFSRSIHPNRHRYTVRWPQLRGASIRRRIPTNENQWYLADHLSRRVSTTTSCVTAIGKFKSTNKEYGKSNSQVGKRPSFS